MMRMLRLIRGIATTGLTWAVVWVPFSLIPVAVASLFGAALPMRVLTGLVIGKALTGAISGAAFASFLAAVGRRRTFESLTLPWIAGLGALGGALFPSAIRATLLATMDVSLPASVLVSGLVTSALLGAGCASATLAIARRAPALPRSDEQSPAAISAGAT